MNVLNKSEQNHNSVSERLILISGIMGICFLVDTIWLRHKLYINFVSYTKKFKRIFLSKKTFYFDEEINGKSVENFKEFMLNIKSTDEIDIVLQTNGGLFSCAQMISDIILAHQGVSNSLVLNNAFSAGTLIALSCKNLYMHKNSHLSPVDVIHSNFFDAIQLSSIKKVIENKSKDRIDDKTFLLADQASKCKLILDELFNKIIKTKYNDEISKKIKEELFDG
jgi:ClpP class serine protease